MWLAAGLLSKVWTSKWTAIVVLHAALTLDAYSTNRLVNYPGGRELNPLMRPFAGHKTMYAAENLAAIPFDVWLLKSKKSGKVKKLTAGMLGWAAGTYALAGRNFSVRGNIEERFKACEAYYHNGPCVWTEGILPNPLGSPPSF